MQAFTVHSGRGLPLRRSNVDTDQIIPSDYLKRISRTGFADGLFQQWRTEPGFVLDDPRYAGATVLLAGPDFGTGSSREHAVWALQDWGFRVVISARFADIFEGNALQAGLLPVRLPADVVEELMTVAEGDPIRDIVVDLTAQLVRCGDRSWPFVVEETSRWRLMEGLDAIDLAIRHDAAIADFETRRPSWMPNTVPL